MKDGVECARDATLGLRQFVTDASQRHRGPVLHLSVLVQNGVNATNHRGEGHDIRCQALQGRVVVGDSLVCIRCVASVQVVDNIADGLQRTAQVKDLVFFQMGISQTDTCYRLTHIEEVLHREIVGRLLQTAELIGLLQPFIHLVGIRRKLHLVHHITPQRALTVAFQQRSYLVKTYLVFVVVRVNHAAKLIILRLLSKKVF